MYEKHILNNGVKVYLSPLPMYRSAAIGFWFKTGSIYESKSENGISHFIEHMMFKGSKKYDAKMIAEYFDSIGGDLNAFTSKECTCYHSKVLDTNLIETIEIMCDMISHPKLDDEDIDKEKGVVLDEILMAEDTPDDVSYDLLATNTYKSSTLGQPILGSKETVSSFTASDLSEYLKQHYTSGNMVISLSGNFDSLKVIEALNQHLDLPEGSHVDVPEQIFTRSIDYVNRDIEQVHLEVAYEAYPYNSDNLFSFAALNTILGASVSSRLFQTIREDHGLTYGINSYITQYETSGMLNIYASMHKENLLKVVTLLSEELNKVRQLDISEDEVKRAKQQLRGNYILDLEGPDSFMNLIGKGKLFSKPIYEIQEIEDRVNKITLDSINNCVREILNRKPTLTLVGKIDKTILNECYEILGGEYENNC